MKRIAALSLVLLGACSDIPRARTEQEIRDLARQEDRRLWSAIDNHAGNIESHGSQIKALRDRLDKLEDENRELRDKVNTLERYELLR